MFYIEEERVEDINFLASAKFITFTYQVNDEGVVADENGRKIVPAGTVYPSNDANAIGILFNDVDVTNGPQPASVIVDGIVIESRLPEPVADTAKDAMKKVSFKVANPQDVEPPVEG